MIHGPIGSITVESSLKTPDLERILGDFKNCLAGYREQMNAWYGGMLDVEQRFSVGDEVVTKSKGITGPVKLYATCRYDSTLTLVHSFEAARFVPIGNTPVYIEPVKDVLFVTVADGDGLKI